MKMKNRIAMLLALLMTLSLCSCGGGGKESETNMNTETKTETIETETETEAPLERVDETGNGNRVMTFVMGRERTSAISGSYNTWNNRGEFAAHKPDCTTEDGLRDISSVYYPSIGLYDVTDPDYQEYMMQLCRMCYIDTINYYLHSTDDLSPSKSIWSKSFDDLTLDMLRKYGLSSSARLASWDDDAKAGQYFTALLDKLEDTVLTIDRVGLFNRLFARIGCRDCRQVSACRRTHNRNPIDRNAVFRRMSAHKTHRTTCIQQR